VQALLACATVLLPALPAVAQASSTTQVSKSPLLARHHFLRSCGNPCADALACCCGAQSLGAMVMSFLTPATIIAGVSLLLRSFDAQAKSIKESVDTQIKAQKESTDAQKESTDAQIKALKESTDAQIKAISEVAAAYRAILQKLSP
jgi:hypothetical protein